MKRLVYVMMALVVLFAANSCKDKKTVPVISTNDCNYRNASHGEGNREARHRFRFSAG